MLIFVVAYSMKHTFTVMDSNFTKYVASIVYSAKWLWLRDFLSMSWIHLYISLSVTLNRWTRALEASRQEEVPYASSSRRNFDRRWKPRGWFSSVICSPWRAMLRWMVSKEDADLVATEKQSVEPTILGFYDFWGRWPQKPLRIRVNANMGQTLRRRTRRNGMRRRTDK